MRKIALLTFVLSVGSVFGQQLHLNTQYLFNEMLVNPGATGGARDYIPVQINFRKQWSGFPGSPTTQSISCHSEVWKNMGFGGNVFNDNSGPSRRTGINVNGAYHLSLDGLAKKKYLGFGMGVSLAQHVIDVNKLKTYLPDDPAVLRGYNNKMVPDASVGVFYKYKQNAFIGLSAHNLVQTNRDLFEFEDKLINPLVRTYYLFAGYDIPTESEMVIKTSTLIQAIETGTVQFDINAIVVYKNFVWLGAAYRHLDAISVLAGAQVGQIKFGYSYDYTLSDIGKYSNGSHEVFLELQLYNKNGSGGSGNWFKRSLRYAPKI